MEIKNIIFTLLLFGGYLFLWFIKNRELFKSEGIDAEVLKKSKKPTQKYFNSLQKVMTASVIFIIIIHALAFNKYVSTSPLISINLDYSAYGGFLLGLLGLTLCKIAQRTIGNSWRVGIDEESKSELIKNGIYKYVRNPTYTGLFMLSGGIWFIYPTALFSLWVLGFIIMMEFQVRCEEEYLEEHHGKEYRDYFNSTRRYI